MATTKTKTVFKLFEFEPIFVSTLSIYEYLGNKGRWHSTVVEFMLEVLTLGLILS